MGKFKSLEEKYYKVLENKYKVNKVFYPSQATRALLLYEYLGTREMTAAEDKRIRQAYVETVKSNEGCNLTIDQYKYILLGIDLAVLTLPIGKEETLLNEPTDRILNKAKELLNSHPGLRSEDATDKDEINKYTALKYILMMPDISEPYFNEPSVLNKFEKEKDNIAKIATKEANRFILEDRELSMVNGSPMRFGFVRRKALTNQLGVPLARASVSRKDTMDVNTSYIAECEVNKDKSETVEVTLERKFLDPGYVEFLASHLPQSALDYGQSEKINKTLAPLIYSFFTVDPSYHNPYLVYNMASALNHSVDKNILFDYLDAEVCSGKDNTEGSLKALIELARVLVLARLELEYIGDIDETLQDFIRESVDFGTPLKDPSYNKVICTALNPMHQDDRFLNMPMNGGMVVTDKLKVNIVNEKINSTAYGTEDGNIKVQGALIWDLASPGKEPKDGDRRNITRSNTL